jgi:hypothetical protein
VWLGSSRAAIAEVSEVSHARPIRTGQAWSRAGAAGSLYDAGWRRVKLGRCWKVD